MDYRRTTEFEEADYISQPPRSRRGDSVRVLEREHDVAYTDQHHRDRMPVFLRDPERRPERRPEQGPLVLRRRREVESVERERHHRGEERRKPRRAQSESPPAREPSRTRVVETERITRHRARSPSPVVRFVERVERVERDDSSGSDDEDYEHIRITERERGRSPPPERSPSPSPPPVIRAPTVERNVITHYTDIDHGVVRARPRSPTPPARERDDFRETDIDIHLDRHNTDVDIRRKTRSRSRSRSRARYYRADEVDVLDDTARLRVDAGGARLRRARSVTARDDEGDYIAGRIDRRGRMGEARGGATREWEYIDVPPGTERVRMDGAGGARTDTTWTRYGGERRTRFIPDRGGNGAVLVPVLKNRHEGGNVEERRLNVAVVDRDTEIDIEQTRRRGRASPRPPGTWTRISRDEISRDSLERMGYPFEEGRHYFYIKMFLNGDRIQELIELTEDLGRAPRRRAVSRGREVELDIEIDPGGRHHHARPGLRRRRVSSGHLDEHFRELEVEVDGRMPRGGYYYY